MQPRTKIYNFILYILVFIIGMSVGAIITTNSLYPPAYPGTGDWNGDGVINLLDIVAAIDELINGTKYPEIVYG